MLEKLVKLVQDYGHGFCVVVECCHTTEIVIKIYKHSTDIEDNTSPLISVNGLLDSASAEAYILFSEYVNEFSEEEKEDCAQISIDVKYTSVRQKSLF